jgi:hypothetical protein
MLDAKYLVMALSLSTLSTGLPLQARQKPRDLARRVQQYSIVNVDGGSSTIVDVQTQTETVKITTAAPTVTNTVVATVEPTPAPTPPATSRISSPTPSPTRTPSSTLAPHPSIITVIVTETPSVGPTEYYDNGIWHTSYVVKTRWDAVVTPSPSAPFPSLDPSIASYNRTSAI